MLTPDQARSGKTHRDENFPVASRVVHPRHRGIILAFYRFVRAADDVADHPSLVPAAKLALLDRLEAALLGSGPDEADAAPLRRALAERGLPARHALDLLAAFRLDVTKRRYDDWADLVGYCALSAMPVGRFVLDVHGEPTAIWPASDALCAALQIINHLQDCAADYRRLDRVYLPKDALARHGARLEDLAKERAGPALRACIADLAERTEALLSDSAGFADRIRDLRLALEVAAIHRLAVVLAGRLRRRDPLAERVHLGKAGFAVTATVGMGAALLRRPWRRPSTSAASAGRA